MAPYFTTNAKDLKLCQNVRNFAQSGPTVIPQYNCLTAVQLQFEIVMWASRGTQREIEREREVSRTDAHASDWILFMIISWRAVAGTTPRAIKRSGSMFPSLSSVPATTATTTSWHRFTREPLIVPRRRQKKMIFLSTFDAVLTPKQRDFPASLSFSAFS